MSRILCILLLYCAVNVHTFVAPDQICTPPDWFQCRNGRCVSFTFECDGEDDCGDHSDEDNCGDFKFVPPSANCTEEEYKCLDNTCIPIERFCDTKADCLDGSDEYSNCVKDKKCNAFRCNDGHCIRTEWLCDGLSDCSDGSDELNCGNSNVPPEECTNEYDRYLCKNSRCISLSLTCNKKDECGDGSDENEQRCQESEHICTTQFKCTQVCRRTPEGAFCSCHPGYKLMDNITCTDINECELFGSCYQQCTNSAGSFTCSCQSGYSLQEDKKSCKADGGEALMVLASKSDIRGYYVDSEQYFPLVSNLQHAIGVSLDTRYVYWSDIEHGDETIMKGEQDGSSRQIIASAGVDTPEDVAVDWITGNIYFTDSGYKRIAVCNYNGSYCTVVINERDKPRALVLAPLSGMMYWSDWGANPHLAVASMDGKNILPLVTDKINWPNGLTIDYPNDRLYWVDAKYKTIESIRLDGRDRRTILSDIVRRPYSLAVFENKLYWSDWSSNTVECCDKFTGKDWRTVLHANSLVYGMHIYHSVLKPKARNPCNGDPCSQMCLLNSNNSYTCACTLDKELTADGHSCRALKKKEHIVIAAGNTFIDYYHELLGKPKMTANLTMKHITALAYDSLTGDVLASDQLSNMIFRYNIESGQSEGIISVKNEMLGGMDFDYVGNNLYWTDIEHNTIEVHSLSTKGKTVFYFQEEPHDIALVPEEGIMYVVFHSYGKYHIDKLQMNGLGVRARIVEENLQGPVISLCYDAETKRIFWSDQGTGRIESISLKGDDRYLFRTGLEEPMSLTILGQHVFWTQRGSDHLYWIDKTADLQKFKRVGLSVPKKLDSMHVVALHGIYAKDEHECRMNNGNCSHVCLPTGSHSHICGCPPGTMLNRSNQTCNIQTACEVGSIRCSEHDVCIKMEQKCDGIVDCPNGEDESTDCEQVGPCAKDEFTCKNGQCIKQESHCDSHYDCKDRSDEENCKQAECKSDEFQCHEGGCISKYLICDGNTDCSDFSDELNCHSHTCDSNSFTCDTRTCIPKSWLCDGEIDCEDGSDEDEKCRQNSCPKDSFTCHNGRCLDARLVCNFVDDCGDNTDERQCAKQQQGSLVNCTEKEYRCFNTDICLPLSKRCNGIQDCPKNDDERDCASCQEGEFACDNKKCIHQSWVCDTKDDCGDKSDEKGCSGRSAGRNFNTSSNCEEFQCTTGTCIPYSKTCDGYHDCADGSDEKGKCLSACSMDNPCGGVCRNTPLGPVCSCQKGYRLAMDGISCVDENECVNENVCSHICHNNRGSYTCSCYEGYVLQKDRRSCKLAGAQMEIVTVTRNDIRKMPLNLSAIDLVHQEEDLDISGFDVNANEDTIYWSNGIMGVISMKNIYTSEQKSVVKTGRPETIAIDWITNNVYFFDDNYPYTIKVCNMDEEKCAKILNVEGPFSKVMSITTDPLNGLFFWSQTKWQGYEGPSSKIYKANMTGTDVTVIVDRNLGVVSSLSVDYRKSRLYWTDTHLKLIESSNFDGSARKLFLKTEKYMPLDIDIYENFLYWLMGDTGKLQKCMLHDGKSCQIINIGPTNIDKHFSVLHRSKQPIGKAKNYCKDHKCGYMCVLQKSNSACICQDGYKKESTSCKINVDTDLKFSSHLSNSKRINVPQEPSALTAIVVIVIVVIAILSGYLYYRQVKRSSARKQDLSIHFQNPSYDRGNEILTSFNRPSMLTPGEHEYINPTVNISTKNKIDIRYSDYSESDSEEQEQKSVTRLLK